MSLPPPPSPSPHNLKSPLHDPPINEHLLLHCHITGKVNSSKAGLTRFVYWSNTWSNSRPLSLISRTTAESTKMHAHTGYYGMITGFTPSSKTGVAICVHKEFHVHQIPHFTIVEYQNPLYENDICSLNSACLRTSAKCV